MKIPIIFLFLVAYCFAEPVTIHLQKFKSQHAIDRDNGVCRNTTTPSQGTRHRRQSSGTVSLTDYYDAEYVGQIQVGSSSKTFNVMFDTGSPDLWLPSIDCTQPACLQHNQFNCAASSSCTQLNQSYSIQYGSGSASGSWVQDSVTIGGLTVQQQQFGYITNEPGDVFLNSQFDGILGMSYPFDPSEPPVFNNLISANQVQPLFSFFLNRNVNDQSQPGGVLTLGGTGSGYFTGSITYLDVINQSWWTVALDSVTDSNNNNYTSSTNCILDTGTTQLLGPPSIIDMIHQQLRASKDQNGEYYWPCSSVSSLPSVIFTMSNNTFPLSSGFYSQQSASGNCYSSFGYMPNGMTNPGWILGDVFIGAYFTVFNFGTNQVGLATSTSQPSNGGQK